jgi:hypothetical protein
MSILIGIKSFLWRRRYAALINIHQRAPISKGNTLRAGTTDFFQAY